MERPTTYNDPTTGTTTTGTTSNIDIHRDECDSTNHSGSTTSTSSTPITIVTNSPTSSSSCTNTSTTTSAIDRKRAAAPASKVVATQTTVLRNNKRSRCDESNPLKYQYKVGDDDDEDEHVVDLSMTADSATAAAAVVVGITPPGGSGSSTTGSYHDTDTSSTIALTEVVTTIAAPTVVVNPMNTSSTSLTNHHQYSDHNDNTVDAEQQQSKLQIMAQACRTILQCIGEDPDREGLQKTPERWAKALLYLCHGYHLSPSQVTNNAVFYENHNEMVVVRNIDIHSLCEHHMVPFTGHVHIGYIPNGKIIGLSKLARLADLFARRLQVQERLTRQIADAILETITPLGVAVVMECTHYCMVMRGVQKTGTITTTSSVRGCFETNSKTRAEFFSILHGGGK